jgi:hypothetical protein
MPKPSQIPFPLSSFPGQNPQEGAGRLINCHAEPLGEPGKPSAPAQQKWVGSPGLSQQSITAETNYRGGMQVKNLAYEVFQTNVVTVDVAGNKVVLGNMAGTKKVSITRDQASNPDVVAVDVDNGAYVLNTTAVANAALSATIAGGSFVAADTVSLTFFNNQDSTFPLTVTYTLVGGAETATTVATGLKNAINANTKLSAVNLTATSALGVISIIMAGQIGNSTSLTSSTTGTGTETVTFNPVSGQMAGGAGTVGIVFTGAPLAYNGLGNLPQPNSVANQDGYFFFTIADGRVFATRLNSLQLNPLTYVTIQAKADVTLLRGIPFSGLMLFFTTGHCEAWQDAANPAPNFPYSRYTILEYGLLQSPAIAGWETGFSELFWAAQDFGVYWLTPGSLQPVKVSPPDLDRLIEARFHAGDQIEAGCYVEGGKKFWHLSSSQWSWEINVSTKKWNERVSLKNGVYGRWRATCGHPAFGNWLVGDQQSGNILMHDLTNYTENGAPLLFRIESGPARDFPQQLRIARADFDFAFGTSTVVGNYQMTVLGASGGTGSVVRLTVNQTSQAVSGDEVQVVGVTGTTEANGTFPMRVVDGNHIELLGTVFANAYISGGIATDLTAPPGASNAQCAISCSKDGGQTFDTPSVRSLAPQRKVKRSRASVKNRGQAGPVGVRWRIDITDPVYRSLMGATMSSDPREVAP